MAISALYEPTESFHPFPNASDVFATEVGRHANFLLPLATLDLAHLRKGWHGRVHFVQPIEPWQEVVGQYTSEYHSSLCRPNWVGYRLDESSRYAIDCDFRYFRKAYLEAKGELEQKESAELTTLNKHYEAVRQSYAAHKQHFQQFGALHAKYAEPVDGRYPEDTRQELVYDLGRLPGWGNWAESKDFPLRVEKIVGSDGQPESQPYPMTDDRGEFMFVGWLHAFTYASGCSCNLYLFYNHEARLALTTFDWC
jgi:hypothetical protein